MENFYKLRYAQNKNEVFLEFMSEISEQDLKIGKYTPSEPIKAKISEGKKFYDIVRFQDPFNFAISEKVFHLLKNNHISGWGTFEISVEGLKEIYYGFQVLGVSGELLKPKEQGIVTAIGFEYSTWDKSDIFAPAGTMALLCTQKVRNIFIENKITNVEFVDISTIEWFNT